MKRLFQFLHEEDWKEFLKEFPLAMAWIIARSLCREYKLTRIRVKLGINTPCEGKRYTELEEILPEETKNHCTGD